MEKERLCLNCKYFKRYYVLNVSLRFVPTDKGFCMIKRCKGGSKRDVEENESCDLWQQIENQKSINRRLVENVLQDINKKLEAVRVLLSEDKD